MPQTTPKRSPIDQLIATRPVCLKVLRLLLELAQDDRASHVGTLSAHLGMSTQRLAQALLHLDRAGLVRAEGCRLTMAGLVLASRLPPIDQQVSSEPAAPVPGDPTQPGETPPVRPPERRYVEFRVRGPRNHRAFSRQTWMGESGVAEPSGRVRSFAPGCKGIRSMDDGEAKEWVRH